MKTRAAGFTLLEVMIALAILAAGLAVLVQSEATAVMMTHEGDRIRTATLLAEEKMTEALLDLEKNGWGVDDLEEDGDFEDFGAEDFRGEEVDIELGDALDDYKWAYTVRRIELNLPTDLMGTAGDIVGTGYLGEENASNVNTSNAPDIGDFISPDQISEQLSGYIREVRVRVWWGDNEEELDQVELVSHAINPTGEVFDHDETATVEE